MPMRPALPFDQVLHAILEFGIAAFLQQSFRGVNPLRLIQRLQPHLRLKVHREEREEAVLVKEEVVAAVTRPSGRQ